MFRQGVVKINRRTINAYNNNILIGSSLMKGRVLLFAHEIFEQYGNAEMQTNKHAESKAYLVFGLHEKQK